MEFPVCFFQTDLSKFYAFQDKRVKGIQKGATPKIIAFYFESDF